MSRFFLSGLLSRIKVGPDGEDMMSVVTKTGVQIPIFIKDIHGHVFELKTTNEIVVRKPKDYLPSPALVKLVERSQAAAAKKQKRMEHLKPFSTNNPDRTSPPPALSQEQLMQIQQQRHLRNQQASPSTSAPQQQLQNESEQELGRSSSSSGDTNEGKETVLKTKKITELREHLKNQNLPQYGTKEQLVQRLMTEGKVDDSML